MYGANPYLNNKMQIGFKGGFMAEYDGSIRINTHIDTSGIARGMVEIRQTIERGMSGQKPMRNMEQEVKQLGDSFSDTADKVSKAQTVMESQNYTQNMTKEAKEVQKEIDSLQKKLLSIYDSQERFLATGGKEDSPTYKRMVYDAEVLEDKLQRAEQTMESLVSSGKAFTIGADSDAEYMRQAEENIDRVIARLEEKNKLEAQTLPEQPRYGTEVESWQRGVSWQEGQREAQALADAVASVGQNAQDSATKSNEAIASMTQELAELKARQKELEKQGMGLGFEEYDANVQRIAEINSALNDYRRELTDTSSSYMSLKEVAQNTLKMMARGLIDIPVEGLKAGLRGAISLFKNLGNMAVSALKRTGTAIQKFAISPLQLMGAITKKAFSSIGKSSKSSNNILNKGFKAILKYGLGIRSMYILINKLRTAIKEGFSNLYNDKNMAAFKTQVDSLKASLLTLKNSFAAAFRPLVEVAIPYIQMLIDYMIRLLNVVGQFMAAITGQDKYTRAVRQTTAAIEEQNKAQKKQLSNLDSLNNLTSDNGSGGKDTTGMFEEVPVEDKWQDIVDRLKKMWENSDFSDLGKSIGEWLKNALDGIPWNEIKEKARKLGESIATLINGFIEVNGLGYSIGHTLAEAINTGFAFLNDFVRGIHADSAGKFLAETINGITESIEWDTIYDTFTTGAHKLAELLNNFFSPDNLNYAAVSSTISNFVNTIVESLYVFITETEWDKIGESLGETLSNAWTGIDWAKAGETLGEYFKAFFDFVGKAIEAVDWWAVGESVKDFLVGIDWAGVADSFFEAVGAAFGGLAAFLGGLIAEGVVSAAEYFQDKIEDAGGNVVEGILVGIAEALVGIGDWIKEHIFNPFINGFKKAFEIHSPSKVMSEMGGFIVSGLLDGLKEKWKSVVDWITEKINWLKDKLSGIAGKVTSAFTGGWNSSAKSGSRSTLFSAPAVSTPYAANPAFAALSTAPIPKLATGAVIPANKEFLAVLDDQKHGTNTEAPIGMIEEAVINAMAKVNANSGSSNSGNITLEIPVIINGIGEIGRAVQQFDREFFKQSGRHAFT